MYHTNLSKNFQRETAIRRNRVRGREKERERDGEREREEITIEQSWAKKDRKEGE